MHSEPLFSDEKFHILPIYAIYDANAITYATFSSKLRINQRMRNEAFDTFYIDCIE